MRHHIVALLVASIFVVCAAPATSHATDESAAFYRWQDAGGRWHFSNRADRVPDSATRLELPPPTAVEPEVRRPHVPVGPSEGMVPGAGRDAGEEGRPGAGACAPDSSGVAEAVVARLADTRHLNQRKLLAAAGVLIAYPDDWKVFTIRPTYANPAAATEAGALAYPGNGHGPARPPFDRYAVTNGHGMRARLCDDFRRAFAEVGIAANRDRETGRPFRAIARRFAAVAARGYVAGVPSDEILVQLVSSGRYDRLVVGSPDAPTLIEGTIDPHALVPTAAVLQQQVALPPWIVEAHIAQTAELADETDDFVEELTVALEEIDTAARRAGCW